MQSPSQYYTSGWVCWATGIIYIDSFLDLLNYAVSLIYIYCFLYKILFMLLNFIFLINY